VGVRQSVRQINKVTRITKVYRIITLILRGL
jgi:hypothetical protein